VRIEQTIVERIVLGHGAGTNKQLSMQARLTGILEAGAFVFVRQIRENWGDCDPPPEWAGVPTDEVASRTQVTNTTPATVLSDTCSKLLLAAVLLSLIEHELDAVLRHTLTGAPPVLFAHVRRRVPVLHTLLEVVGAAFQYFIWRP
jgi:hypothetical protein